MSEPEITRTGFEFPTHLVEKLDEVAGKFERNRTYVLKKLMEHTLFLPIKELGDIINPPVK